MEAGATFRFRSTVTYADTAAALKPITGDDFPAVLATTRCIALLELAARPDVVGVKQAVGGVDADTLRLLAGAPGDFAVLGGDDQRFVRRTREVDAGMPSLALVRGAA